MNSALALLSVIFCTCHIGSVQAAEWNYTDQDAWKTVPGWYCAGMRQSPINIVRSSVVTNPELVELKLWNFDQYFNGTFINNGHTVRFDLAPGSPAALFQNHMGTYELQQFHFHWGDNDARGSEHWVNGEPTSGELHFVTKRTTGSSTTGNAYAVLGVFFTAQTSLPMTDSLQKLFNNIPPGVNNEHAVYGVRLSDFIPTHLEYYYYEGSLTTPPCSEVVQWFVLQYTTYVPSDFFAKLRLIQSSSGGSLNMNYRYTQPLNGRDVMTEPTCYVAAYNTGDQL